MPDGDSQSIVVNFPSKAKIPHLYCGNVTLKDHHCKYLILSQCKTMHVHSGDTATAAVQKHKARLLHVLFLLLGICCKRVLV